MSAADISDLRYQESGLLGISNVSGDMQTLLDSETPAAQEAVDLFVYRIGRELGSLAAALGGLGAPGVHRQRRGACRAGEPARLRWGRLSGRIP